MTVGQLSTLLITASVGPLALSGVTEGVLPPVIGPDFYAENPDLAICEALKRCQEGRGSQRRAAEMLGITRDVVAQRIHRAGESSPLYPLKAGSDERLAKILEEHGGDRQQASRATGISMWAISERILKASPDSPLAIYRTPSVEAMAFALGWYQGDIDQAATSLGLLPINVRQQIKFSTPGSPLYPFLVSDTQIDDALRECGGNRAEAARTLGENPDYLLDRIRRAEVGSALEKWKRPDITDEALAEFLDLSRRNLRATGKHFGIDPREIIGRISGAKEDSPLARFQIDEKKILAELQRANGSVRAAARLLNMDHASLWWRLQTAQDSLLRNWTHDNPFIRALAIALERNGGNVETAAKEMGWETRRAKIMIGRAKPGSVLERYK